MSEALKLAMKIAEASVVLPTHQRPRLQSQASLLDQLRALIPLANAAGLYDAADYLRHRVEASENHAREIGGIDAHLAVQP